MSTFPSYIKQTVAYRSGQIPTADEINSYFNLLIEQGDLTTTAVAAINVRLTNIENAWHDIVVNKIGIDDSVTNTSQGWSSSKTSTELALKTNTADIVDNLTSTSTTAPLSANQGKVLNDSITALTTIASEKQDALTNPVVQSDIVNNLTSTSTTAPLSAAQGKVLKGLADEHIATGINTANGVHGFRYYNDKLQVKNDEGEWVSAESGGGGISPSNVINPEVKVGNGKLTISWADPGNIVVDGRVLCIWKGTKLVQKVGAYPENAKDGVQLVDNQVLNAYKTNGFEITGLTNGTTYYFGLFPYSDVGATNISTENRLSGTPQSYKIMTVNIGLTNSNPATCITYADDAVGMTPGSSAWDEFFGHYPVLFKNCAEVGKLKTTNFAQFEDGSVADITSGDAGDVMIAFPRRGLKITTVGDTLTISMTDDPDNADFEYLAHTRGTTRKEKFYLGAYKGYVDSKLRSLSGKTPTATQTIGTFRTQAQAQANGAGYEQSGFYQLMFRQAMYLLKYKNLNSQVAVGRGYVNGDSAAIATGGTNAKGMDFGETTGKLQMKLFGLEDFWGNVWEWIDGIVTTSTRNMLTATTGFNDTGSGYTDQGQCATADIGGYMKKPQGSTKTGFLAKEVSGSETTYFCDYTNLFASCVACFGGFWGNASAAGAFQLDVIDAASYRNVSIAARLMYL